jgi:hypothetical protein
MAAIPSNVVLADAVGTFEVMVVQEVEGVLFA